jgi:signal peptidase I
MGIIMDNIKKEQAAAKNSIMGLYDWLQCIVSAVITGILIFIFIVRINGINGPSMMQTLQNGDTVVLSNLFFTPKYKDIIFIKTDYFGDTPIVKRVIATAGQIVDIDFVKGIVYVDGKQLQEPYVNTPTNRQENFTGPVTVPEGQVFVMGDNRNESNDSRDKNIGLVDTRNIIGKVYFVLIPGSGYNSKRDWSRFGSVYS